MEAATILKEAFPILFRIENTAIRIPEDWLPVITPYLMEMENLNEGQPMLALLHLVERKGMLCASIYSNVPEMHQEYVLNTAMEIYGKMQEAVNTHVLEGQAESGMDDLADINAGRMEKPHA